VVYENRNSLQRTAAAVLIGAVQKQFIDELKRVLSQHHGHGRALTEGAAVTCVKLCKSSTYVNITDRANVLFLLVHTVNQDLKVCTTTAAPVAVVVADSICIKPSQSTSYRCN